MSLLDYWYSTDLQWMISRQSHGFEMILITDFIPFQKIRLSIKSNFVITSQVLVSMRPSPFSIVVSVQHGLWCSKRPFICSSSSLWLPFTARIQSALSYIIISVIIVCVPIASILMMLPSISNSLFILIKSVPQSFEIGS